MAKAIHSMIRVLDEQRSLSFYEKAFGLTVAERLAFEGFTLVYLSNDESEFELELTINHGRAEPYAIGDGYGHLAVSVDDLEAEHARVEALGFDPTPLKELKLEGRPPARFFFVQDPDGYKIEVLQRGGRCK
jgi:lactoylglutathione lyase